MRLSVEEWHPGSEMLRVVDLDAPEPARVVGCLEPSGTGGRWQARFDDMAPFEPGAGSADGRGETFADRAAAVAAVERLRGPSFYTFYDHEGALFRRRGNIGGVRDILRDGRWVPYAGSDLTKPWAFGDQIDDPLALPPSPRIGP